MNDRQSHWQTVYSTKTEDEVSWFQETPAPSLDLLALAGAHCDSAIIDVGGGASRLVDRLLAEGYGDLTVLDLSPAALDTARARLGRAGERVTWIAEDATRWRPARQYDVWHDRAAFHFLTSPEDQRAYVERLKEGLRVGGHVIIGTFAVDGPEKCSGLPVARHSPDTLAAILGPGFDCIDARRHAHATPWGSVQNFQFSTFRRTG